MCHFLQHLVQHRPEIERIHLPLLIVQWLHAEYMLEIEAEGTFQVILKLGNRQLLQVELIYRNISGWTSFEQEADRWWVIVLPLVGISEKLFGTLGKFRIATAEEQSRRLQRVTSAGGFVNHKTDTSISLAGFDKSLHQISISGKPVLIVPEA